MSEDSIFWASVLHAASFSQVMFLQRKDQVIMTIELLDTEETQTEDPMEVQVILILFPSFKDECDLTFLGECMEQNVPRRAERD